MNDRAAMRLEELKREFDTGKRVLAGLEVRVTELRATLLRISGAIQVLEEITTREADAAPQVASLRAVVNAE